MAQRICHILNNKQFENQTKIKSSFKNLPSNHLLHFLPNNTDLCYVETYLVCKWFSIHLKIFRDCLISEMFLMPKNVALLFHWNRLWSWHNNLWILDGIKLLNKKCQNYCLDNQCKINFFESVPDAVPFGFADTFSVTPSVWIWLLRVVLLCTLGSVVLSVRVSGTFDNFVDTSSPVNNFVLDFLCANPINDIQISNFKLLVDLESYHLLLASIFQWWHHIGYKHLACFHFLPLHLQESKDQDKILKHWNLRNIPWEFELFMRKCEIGITSISEVYNPIIKYHNEHEII